MTKLPYFPILNFNFCDICRSLLLANASHFTFRQERDQDHRSSRLQQKVLKNWESHRQPMQQETLQPMPQPSLQCRFMLRLLLPHQAPLKPLHLILRSTPTAIAHLLLHKRPQALSRSQGKNYRHPYLQRSARDSRILAAGDQSQRVQAHLKDKDSKQIRDSLQTPLSPLFREQPP